MCKFYMCIECNVCPVFACLSSIKVNKLFNLNHALQRQNKHNIKIPNKKNQNSEQGWIKKIIKTQDNHCFAVLFMFI